jgi:hypothetical protein
MDSSFVRSSSSLGRKKEKTTICFIDTFPLSYSGFFVFLSLSLSLSGWMFLNIVAFEFLLYLFCERS